MNIHAEAIRNKEDSVKITIYGKLGSAVQKEFRKTYEENPAKNYVIDLEKVDGMDSSGLGMMLLMRDHVGGANSDIELINCSEHILDILNVTCFYKLFKIAQFDNKDAANDT